MTQPQPLVATKLAKQKIHYKMAQAQDLRLENLVLKDGKIVSVIAINSTEIATDDNNGFYFEEVFEPIPLSPKILEAAGFERSNLDGDNEWLRLRYKTISFETDESSGFNSVWVYVRGHEIVRVYYLHQLQNLFYSLTGEELTIDINALTEKV